jgi:hypothetical protein
MIAGKCCGFINRGYERPKNRSPPVTEAEVHPAATDAHMSATTPVTIGDGLYGQNSNDVPDRGGCDSRRGPNSPTVDALDWGAETADLLAVCAFPDLPG